MKPVWDIPAGSACCGERRYGAGCKAFGSAHASVIVAPILFQHIVAGSRSHHLPVIEIKTRRLDGVITSSGARGRKAQVQLTFRSSAMPQALEIFLSGSSGLVMAASKFFFDVMASIIDAYLRDQDKLKFKSIITTNHCIISHAVALSGRDTNVDISITMENLS